MPISRETKIVAGVTLITVPTIAFGGMTLLGVLTGGAVCLAATTLITGIGLLRNLAAGDGRAD